MDLSMMANSSSLRFVSSRCSSQRCGIEGIALAIARTYVLERAVLTMRSSCNWPLFRSKIGIARLVCRDICSQNLNFASFYSAGSFTGENCCFIIEPNSIFFSKRDEKSSFTLTPSESILLSFSSMKEARVVAFSNGTSSSSRSLEAALKLITLSRSSNYF